MESRINPTDIKPINDMVVSAVGGMGILTRNFYDFQKDFVFELGHGKRCSGGYYKGNPIHTYGRQSAHHDYDRAMEMHKSLSWSKVKTWKQAYQLSRKGIWLHVEYGRFHNDREIGGFVSREPYKHVLAECCHEVAHAVDQWNDRWRSDSDQTKSHGQNFQDAYRALRKHFNLIRDNEDSWELVSAETVAA